MCLSFHASNLKNVSGGDAKKLETAPHHEVVDNNDGSYTVKLNKPEHFAVKIDGNPVLRAEFI